MKKIPTNKRYSATELGEIYDHDTKSFVKLHKHNRGYLKASLVKDGKREYHYVHRLIAHTFIDNPDSKPTVNHIDGNKTNNNLENLEWATHKENIHHAMDLGLLNKGAKGQFLSLSFKPKEEKKDWIKPELREKFQDMEDLNIVSMKCLMNHLEIDRANCEDCIRLSGEL